MSMLFVIIMHFLGHGKILEKATFNTIDYYVYWLFRALAYPCVNCFVILSGYYMTKSRIKISKIFRLEFQVIFYSVVLWGISIFVGSRSFSSKEFLYSVTPVSSSGYWYVTTYILLLVISPFLNYAIEFLSRKAFLISISFLLFYTSVIPTFLYWSRNYISKGRDLLWFIVLYLLAGYIRKYDIKCKKKMCLIIYGGSSILMILSNAVIGNITLKLFGNVKATDFFYANNSIVILVGSVALFLFFKDIKIKQCLVFNQVVCISAASFGTYLFHENIFFRDWLWEVICPSRYMFGEFAIVKTLGFMFLSVNIIFGIGVILEIFRIKLFKIIKLEKLERVIAKKVDNLISDTFI